jgi:hypothetical protein
MACRRSPCADAQSLHKTFLTERKTFFQFDSTHKMPRWRKVKPLNLMTLTFRGLGVNIHPIFSFFYCPAFEVISLTTAIAAVL